MKKPYSTPVLRRLEPTAELVALFKDKARARESDSSRGKFDFTSEGWVDKFGFSIGLGFLVAGAGFLYHGSFERSLADQTMEFMFGGVLFSLGLITASLVVKDWRQWKRSIKDDDRSVRK